MNHVELNDFLRELLSDLLKTGQYKKRDVCVATFGGGSSPQFEHFLKGSNVGINPLTRLFDSFGYDLQIVPIPKDSKDEALTNKSVQVLDIEFINDCKKSLIEYLNSDKIKTTRGSVSKVFEKTADNLLKDILNT